MKKLFFVVSALCFTFALQAQRDQTLFNRTGLGLSGAWGGSVIGLTAFDDNYAVTRGGYGGLEFGKNLLIGYGGFRTTDEVAIGQNANSNFDLDYHGLILGYGVKSEKVVHPEILLLVGGGNADVNKEGDDRVLVIQPAAGIEVNVFRWFRFGINGGYRFVANTDLPNLSDKDLSAFYGELKFKFGFSWGR